MNYNDYYNYLNGYSDMNYMTNYNQMMNDLNYQTLMPNDNKKENLNSQISSILDSKDGFERGNLFGSLYDEYKNYKPEKLVAKNEREDMLLQILDANFAMTELNLYLDIYPNDKNALTLFNSYLTKKKNLCDAFEQKYGPLTIESDSQKNNWLWDNSPWPWEVQN